MNFLEKDLEDIIWNTSKTDEGRELLYERGLRIEGKMYRQFALGEYGKFDLVSVKMSNYDINISVYELKKNIVDIQTMFQASRYASAINRYLEEKYPNLNKCINIRSILIGREMDLKGDFPLLYNNSPNFDIYLYSYGLKGLFFTYQVKEFHYAEDDIEKVNIPISRNDINEMKNRRLKAKIQYCY